MQPSTKAHISLLILIGLIGLIVCGITLLEKNRRKQPCEYFKDTDVRNLPVRCLEYFKK